MQGRPLLSLCVELSESKKSKRSKESKQMKRERQDESMAAAKKRMWKAKAHEEQFNVLSKALEPLAKARQRISMMGKWSAARIQTMSVG